MVVVSLMGGGKRWREMQYMRPCGVAGKPERHR